MAISKWVIGTGAAFALLGAFMVRQPDQFKKDNSGAAYASEWAPEYMAAMPSTDKSGAVPLAKAATRTEAMTLEEAKRLALDLKKPMMIIEVGQGKGAELLKKKLETVNFQRMMDLSVVYRHPAARTRLIRLDSDGHEIVTVDFDGKAARMVQ